MFVNQPAVSKKIRKKILFRKKSCILYEKIKKGGKKMEEKIRDIKAGETPVSYTHLDIQGGLFDLEGFVKEQK